LKRTIFERTTYPEKISFVQELFLANFIFIFGLPLGKKSSRASLKAPIYIYKRLRPRKKIRNRKKKEQQKRFIIEHQTS
jgi:hypothetical protein